MLYKRKNGFYYTHFSIKGQQIHRKLHTKDYNEAVRLEAKLKADVFKSIELGETYLLKKISLSEVIKEYQKQSELNDKKSRNTDNSRFKVFNSFFKPLTPIQSIKIGDIEDLKEYLLDEKEVSPTTVNRYLELLSSLFTYAVNHDYVKENVCRKVKKFNKKNYTVRYLTEAEEERLFQHLPEYLKPIVKFALITGLRKSNILNIKRSQIDFYKNTIEVLDNKGNAYLVIPIADKHREELKQLCDSSQDDYLFVNPKTQLPYILTVIKHEKQQKEKFKEAIESYNNALKLDNAFERAIVQKAYCKYQLEDYEGALIDFKSAMKLNPNDSITFLNAGYIAYKLHNNLDVILYLNKAIELNPNLGEVYFLRGTFYYNQKYYHQAIKNFTKAIDLNFNIVGSYSMRASCYLKLDNYFENAIFDYTQLTKLNPQNNKDYYYYIGCAYYSLNKYANALSSFNMAINLSKDCSSNYFVRGLTYQMLNRYNEALLDFEKALELDSKCGADEYIKDCKRKLTLKLIKT